MYSHYTSFASCFDHASWNISHAWSKYYGLRTSHIYSPYFPQKKGGRLVSSCKLHCGWIRNFVREFSSLSWNKGGSKSMKIEPSLRPNQTDLPHNSLFSSKKGGQSTQVETPPCARNKTTINKIGQKSREWLAQLDKPHLLYSGQIGTNMASVQKIVCMNTNTSSSAYL